MHPRRQVITVKCAPCRPSCTTMLSLTCWAASSNSSQSPLRLSLTLKLPSWVWGPRRLQRLLQMTQLLMTQLSPRPLQEHHPAVSPAQVGAIFKGLILQHACARGRLPGQTIQPKRVNASCRHACCQHMRCAAVKHQEWPCSFVPAAMGLQSSMSVTIGQL